MTSRLVLLVLLVALVFCAKTKEDLLTDSLMEALQEMLMADSQGSPYCATDTLRVRDGPCTDRNILTTINAGTQVDYSGVKSDGCGYTWFKISVNGVTGWSASNYLSPCGSPTGSLQDVVTKLGQEAASRSPGTQAGIAVRNLQTGEYGQYNGDVKHVSASSAKAIWVGAALRLKGVAPVQPYAGPIFKNSDNDATGKVIDLIGPNAVNDYYRDLGLGNSAFCQWGSTRVATNCPRAMGSDNYFTANDCVTFLTKVANNQVPFADTLKTWMTWAPRSGYGGWLGTKLPSQAQQSMQHKAGWLPAEYYPDYRTLNDIGILYTPNGGRYAIAILTRKGNDYWGAQVNYLQYVSCVVYSKISGQSLAC
jgi:beta-lactamase class A